MSVERIIGIDFGTSTSLIKVKTYRDGVPADGDPTSTSYVEFDGQYWAPTLIRFAEAEEYYGHETKNLIPGSTLCKNFKLDLQSPDAAAKAQAQELTKKFFRFLYRQYSDQTTRFGQFDAERTLVSYPAKWTRETRDFMVQAAKDAGFRNVSGMDEPTAALYTVMVQESKRLVEQKFLTPGKPAYVLMIDMGAGTTDLALCSYTPGGQNRIIDTWPSAESKVLFGGREMDELLLQYLIDYLKRCGVPEKMLSNFEKQNLEACKSWKEDSISLSLKNNRKVPGCSFVSQLFMMSDTEPLPFPAIDRAVLERYCKDYIGRYAELIAGAMAHARQADPDFGPEKLSLAVLTGGHSQWYFAKDMLCCVLPGYEGGVGVRLMPDQVVNLTQPQGTVSSGLVFSPQFSAQSQGADWFGKKEEAARPQPEPERKRPEYAPPKEPERKQPEYATPKAQAPQPEPEIHECFNQGVQASTGTAEFSVVLQAAGPRVINVVKTVRDIAGIELAEAKSLVDSAPCTVKKTISMEEAEAIKARLNEAGATVEIVEAGFKPLIKAASGFVKAVSGLVKESISTDQTTDVRALTALSPTECNRLIAETGNNIEKILEIVYRPLVEATEDQFIEWCCQEGKYDKTHCEKMSNEAEQMLLAVTSLRGGEKCLFYIDASLSTGKMRNCVFVTTEHIFHIQKSLFGKIELHDSVDFSVVSSIRYVFGGVISLLFHEHGKSSCTSMPAPSEKVTQSEIAAYLRWRVLQGIDPYDVKLYRSGK